jgi:hypothetical protein
VKRFMALPIGGDLARPATGTAGAGGRDRRWSRALAIDEAGFPSRVSLAASGGAIMVTVNGAVSVALADHSSAVAITAADFVL